MLTHAQETAQQSAHENELDAGPRRSGADRFCAATRTIKPVAEMIRFAVGPDGVVPDLKRKLPGRGIWITATRAALSDAVAHKSFARAFKRDVSVAKDLVDLTERLLTRSALDALAMAGKAHAVAAGFSKTEAALARAEVVALLQAAEAGADGVSKLKAALRRRSDADQVAVIAIFSSTQLDLALGRSNVVHAALLAGPASDTFLARVTRLERFRTGELGAAGNRLAATLA
jgi:predicted RNA-binding protein YlxR (DUF448 family)